MAMIKEIKLGKKDKILKDKKGNPQPCPRGKKRVCEGCGMCTLEVGKNKH